MEDTLCLTLPFTMFLIVKIVVSPPAMNMHSKKCQLPIHHPAHQLDNEMIILNTHHHFFTLPNSLDDHTFIHIVQQDTCLFDIQDLEPEALAERMWIKKKQAQ